VSLVKVPARDGSGVNAQTATVRVKYRRIDVKFVKVLVLFRLLVRTYLPERYSGEQYLAKAVVVREKSLLNNLK